MRLIFTPHVRAYIVERYPNLADLVRHMPACRPDTLYKAMRGQTKTLNDRTTAALAAGLGVSEDELLAISMGPAAAGKGAGDHPCAGKPPWLADFCRHWEAIPNLYREHVRLAVQAALGGIEADAARLAPPGRVKKGAA